jgi:hypothetical protein
MPRPSPRQTRLRGAARPPASLIRGSYDSLLQGVSQQPPHVRQPGQGERQVNGWSSLIDGLGKRQNSQFVSKLFSTRQSDLFRETMPVADDERYAVTLTPATSGGLLSVTLGIADATVDVHGSGLTVIQQDGRAYVSFTSNSYLSLSGAYKHGYAFVSSGPLGLLCNRSKVVQLDAAVSPGIQEEALIFIQAVDYQVTYQLSINGSQLTGYTTPKATDTNNTLSTETVAEDLTFKINSVSGFIADTRNSVIYVKRSDGAAFNLGITDGRANTLARIISKKVSLFSALPVHAKPGFKVMIDTDPSNQLDNYYVEFIPNGTGTDIQEGTWQETVAPSIQYKIDYNTMPLVIYRQAPGVVFIGPADGATRTQTLGGQTYTYTFPSWTERTAGDATTVPDPSFIGQRIRDLTIWRSRLAVIAGVNAICSRTDNLFGFFNETSTQVLATDPIDVIAGSDSRSDLEWLLPLEENLLLFSRMSQFQLRAVDGDVLSPTSAYVVKLSNIEMSTLLRPRLAGPNIIFGTYQYGYTGFREYQFFASTGRRLGLNLGANNDITVNVARLIQGQSTIMDVGESLDVMVCNDASNPNRLWVYKYFYQQSENSLSRQQASWSAWTFDGEIAWIRFYDNRLWMILAYNDGTYETVIDLQETVRRDQPVLCLDRAINYPECNTDNNPYNNITATYDTETNRTTFALPYEMRGLTSVVTRFDNNGTISAKGVEIGSATNGNQVVCQVSGNWTGEKLVFGANYTFEYQFTQPYPSTSSQDRTRVVGEQSGRMQLLTFQIHHYNTGYYEVDVLLKNRNRTTHTFKATILNVEGNALQPAFSDYSNGIATGSFRFPVRARNTDASITITSDSWLPARFTGATWEGSYSNRAQRG